MRLTRTRPRRREGRFARKGGAVDVLFSPFLRLWNWIDRVGGYPGQVFFICAVIMLLLGGLTWYGNKR